MDKLEKFIIDHKQDLEAGRMPEEGWDKIRRKLNSPERDWSVYWKVAAVLFFATTMVLGAYSLKVRDTSLQSDNRATIEKFYVNQIDLKKAEYQKIASEEQSEELLNDLAAFDLAYEELSQTFGDLKNEEVAEAMLENLRLRILILNEQIELIRNNKDQEEFYHSS